MCGTRSGSRSCSSTGCCARRSCRRRTIRRLRMLTRYRVQLMGDRTRETIRLELMLEDASIKLSTVASSLTTRLGAGDAGRDDRRRDRSAGAGGDGQGPDAVARSRTWPRRWTGTSTPTTPSWPGRSCDRLDLVEAGAGRARRGDRGRVRAVGAPDRAAADHPRGRAEGRAGDHRRDRRRTCPGSPPPRTWRRGPGWRRRCYESAGKRHPAGHAARQQVADRDAGRGRRVGRAGCTARTTSPPSTPG